MTKRIIIGGLASIVFMITGTLTAVADAPAGNSGHSNNGSTQCKAGGNDHCPPFGP